MAPQRRIVEPPPAWLIAAAVVAIGGSAAIRTWPEIVPAFSWQKEAPLADIKPEPPAPQVPTSEAFSPPLTATLRVYLRPVNDSEASLAQLRELAPLLPRQQIRAERAASVLSLMQDRLGSDQTSLPRTQALLASMASGDDQRVRISVVEAGGFVYLPALPLVPPDTADGPRLGFARFMVSDPGGSIEFSGIIARAERSDALGTAGHVIDYEIRAASLDRPEVQTLVGRDDVELTEAPARIKFARSGCTAVETPFLDAAAETAIRNRTAAARRRVDLVVLDSGWPTADAQRASLERLYAMSADIRTMFGMPTLTPAFPVFQPSGYDHAERIHRALAPLRTLDASPATVRVTYVPLSRAQSSGDILRELIMLSRLIALRGKYPAGAATDKEIEIATQDAAAAVKRLPAVPGLIMPSDKLILDAVNRVAAAVADRSGAYYIANYSFTYEARVLGYEPPAVQRGLGVVAAGNDGLDVNEKGIDLAHRSTTDAHFVTVMNVDAAGNRDCGSSFIADDVLDGTPVVGFTGSLGTESQTSFAAPRVAWLLALAQASTPVDVKVPDSWFVRTRARLLGARPAGMPYGSIRIGPLTLASLLD